MTRPKELTKEWQIEELEKPVLPHFIRQEKEVHGKFTSVDYVRLMLNYVFPGTWDFELISGPSRLDLHVNTALYVCTGRLTVTYADGMESLHEASGATKLEAGWKKDEQKPRPVNEANINQHVMGYLGCRSSALKSCAADLGPVFRPLSDDKVGEFVYERNHKRKVGGLKENHDIDVGEESPQESATDLFGPELTSPQGMPSNVTELYQMAREQLDMHPSHAANVIQNYLDEQFGGGDIGAFAKTSLGNVAVLWHMLVDHQKAKETKLEA